MERREFLRRSTLIAAGVVAADQLEILDRLGWTRTLFSGWSENVLVFDQSIIASVLASQQPRTEMSSWNKPKFMTPAPVAIEMEYAEYRRRYGLHDHTLAFRKDGSWLTQEPS